MSMHRIERIETAANRLEHLIQQAIFLRNESFDGVVGQWLETTKSISSTIGMQEIVFAAEQLLDPEGDSASGRELLRSLPLSLMGEMDHFSFEEKLQEDPQKAFLGESGPEVECWLLSLAINHLQKHGKYAEGLRLCSAANQITTHHIKRIISDCPRQRCLRSRYTGMRPIMSKIYLGQTQIIDKCKQKEGTSASCRRTARKRSLDSKETQLHLMMKDLKMNRRAGDSQEQKEDCFMISEYLYPHLVFHPFFPIQKNSRVQLLRSSTCTW